MHEMGIILHLAKTLEETAEQEKIKKITRVTLEVGEVSGIMTDYFVDCWNYFRRKHPVLETAELTLETIPAVTWCDACKSTYPTVEFGRTCPHCGSGETWLLKGNECIIKEIEVED
jgi:hydrogenase nickel incorporation protein HypA/HybF